MLLNKKNISIIFLFAFLIVSCGDDTEKTISEEMLNDPAFVLNKAKEVLGEKTKNAKAGNFNSDSSTEIAAGTEITNKEEWGIKFHLLKTDDDELIIDYSTELLEGSFDDCQFDKIKFPSFKYELIYYNSLNYFLGTAGGDVFSYVIDFEMKNIYYAHLFIQKGRSISLFLSENVVKPEIRNFFISNFKRDYPQLKIVKEDVNL